MHGIQRAAWCARSRCSCATVLSSPEIRVRRGGWVCEWDGRRSALCQHI